ncbi:MULTISPECIES: hypothetical protein [unclassified Clostridioides]|uniref:hypothetical protein n=1 Tax=unclassified Clostridioides TaxID=2635829 RepID=UPI000A69DA12
MICIHKTKCDEMLSFTIKPRKISIIGIGHVGSHFGFNLVAQGVCYELLMVD